MRDDDSREDARAARRDVPFRVGEQVSDAFFTDRADEVDRVVAAMRTPTRLLLYGERRMGKSSILRQAALRAGREGVVVPWIDVSTVADFGEIADRLVPSIPFRWRWRDQLQALLLNARLELKLGSDPAGRPVLGLTPRRGRPDPREGKERLRAVVEALDRVATEEGARVAVVLDEFQAVDGVLERGSAVLRDVMQTTGGLSWLCAGSELSVVDELIGKSGPYYRFFESLAVGPMDAGHLARWIESRMEGAGVEVESGVGARVLELAGRRTQDALQLARAVFAVGAGKGSVGLADVPAAFERSVLEDAHRFGIYWDGLADSHRRVLRAVAAGEAQLTAQDTRERWGLPTSAAVTKAVRALRAARHLDGATPPRIDDPYFRGWILMKAMPDGVSRLEVEPRRG